MPNSYLTVNWPAPAHVNALFTTRHGGFSAAPFDSFNLAMHVGDTESAVQKNRRKLMDDCDMHSVCWLNQVHGVQVIESLRETVETASPLPPVADASYSRQSGVACAVMVADCMPVMITDKQGSVVGVAHAGWRSLCGGVVSQLLSNMQIDPSETLVWLGPCIGPEAFEVDQDVLHAFQESGAFSGLDVKKAFVPGKGNRYLADLRLLATMQLSRLGVTEIYQSSDCTYSRSDTYFSYRRDGTTGRMAALIWMT